MLKPIQRKSLSDAVFEQLRDQIVSGAMAVGSKLPSERVLCEMLGVNRGALREALKRLEQARLISIQHGGTTKVTDFQQTASLDLLTSLLFSEGRLETKVVRSVMEMRSALAPDIVRLCALRASDEIKTKLSSIVDSMETCMETSADLVVLQRRAMDFWQTAVDGSQNVAYRLAFNTLQQAYERFFELLTQVLSEELQDVEGYRAIARAVARGDTAKAERRAQELIRKGADGVLTMLEAIERAEDTP